MTSIARAYAKAGKTGVCQEIARRWRRHALRYMQYVRRYELDGLDPSFWRSMNRRAMLRQMGWEHKGTVLKTATAVKDGLLAR